METLPYNSISFFRVCYASCLILKKKYPWPKKNERNVTNAAAQLILNHLSHKEESSCCPTGTIKSRIMIRWNLSTQICMRHSDTWNMICMGQNSITKSSKTQICLNLTKYYPNWTFNTKKVERVIWKSKITWLLWLFDFFQKQPSIGAL